MTTLLLLTSLVVAAAALGLGHWLVRAWLGTVVAVGVGIFQLVGKWRGWRWAGSAALILFAGAAAMGVRLGADASWMLLGVVAALAAWDLDHFAFRLEFAPSDEVARSLERHHLLRLLIVVVLGLALGVAALNIRAAFGFGTAVVLGLLAILGLSRAIGFLRRESD
jgi:hypothetical protein